MADEYFETEISRHIWDTKYRYRDGKRIIDRSVEDTWRRIACALAAPEADRDYWIDRFFWILKGFKFLPGGRIQAGAGTGRQVTLFNCFVMGVIEDSIESIFDNLKEGAITMQQGGGVGYDFSTLRPRGTRARGVGAIASGPVSFMDIWDAMCATILSTGARRGAMMGTMRCDHPDIEEFVNAKRTPGRLTRFNMSVLVTDEFMQAVEQDREWPLVFPAESIEDTGEIVYRRWPGKDREVPCVVLRRIRARALWDEIMRATYDHAEPGVIFIDRVNQMNNLHYREYITCTNPCVTADTEVMTSSGPRRVRDLIGRPFEAIVDGRKYRSSSTGFFPTGVKPVFRLLTEEGFSLTVTEDHPVACRRAGGRFEWVAVGDLKRGDRILLHDHGESLEWPGSGSWTEGVTFARYILARQGARTGAIAALAGPFAAPLPCTAPAAGATISPSDLEGRSSDFWRGFHYGLREFGEWTDGRLAIWIDSGPTASIMQRALLRVGVLSRLYRRPGESEPGFDPEQYLGPCWLELLGSSDVRPVATFVELRYVGRRPVFDVSVDTVHAFDANGLYVHNCGEVPLPPYGSCNLGSVNLTAFVEAPFSPDAQINLDAIRDTVRVAVRLLDNVVDVSRYPLEQQRVYEQGVRRLGLGITGLADTLIMLGLHYASDEAIELATRVMREICYTAYRTSIELAREKGPFRYFDRDAYLASRFVAQLPADIRDGIAQWGIRNSHLLAIAPTGTISLLANNISSSLEPVYDFRYERRVLNEDGTATTFLLEDYAYRLWKKLRGDATLPETFVTARDLTPKEHLRMQAALQPFVDNSISKTINIPEDYPFDDFKDVYRIAYEWGLKGCTTFRPNPITGAVLRGAEESVRAPHCCALEREAD